MQVFCLSHVAFAASFADEANGYALEYPDQWSVNHEMLKLGGPLFLSTFPPGAYRHGGFLPPGGIEIVVRVFPSVVDDNLALLPAPNQVAHLKRSVEAIQGRGVLRADYDLTVTEGVTYSATSMAVRMQEKLFVILVMYETPDHSGAARDRGEQALRRIVSTLSSTASRPPR